MNDKKAHIHNTLSNVANTEYEKNASKIDRIFVKVQSTSAICRNLNQQKKEEKNRYGSLSFANWISLALVKKQSI